MADDGRVTLREQMRLAREARGLTQEIAAEQVGIWQATWSEIESGRVRPRANTEALLWRWLGVRPEPVTIGERLRATRGRRGLSQREAAAEAGLSRSAFARAELGGKPRPRTIAIAEAWVWGGR